MKNPKERERIQNEGGIIIESRLGHPVWNPAIINIALTRAIGNLYFKSDQYLSGKRSGLISDAEIVKVNVTSDDNFVIMASDGFWDVVTPQEACKYVVQNKGRNASIVCKELTEMALDKASLDNTTVLLINLNTIHAPTKIKRN